MTLEEPRGDAAHQQHSIRSSASPWVVLTLVAAGLFLAVVSTTVVSVALPTIAAELGASSTDSEWIVDAYVLVYASLLIPGGVLGDRRGRKRIFILGVALFGLGALLAGIAPSTPLLLIGRVIQGLGPALLVPGSLTIIRAVYDDDRQRALAIGLWSTASGLALALGPILGGLIVASVGWRWIFLFNVPLSVALLVLAAKSLPPMPAASVGSRFDWLGSVLSVLGTAALTFAIIEAQARGWNSAVVLAVLGCGVALLIVFVLWQTCCTAPLVNVRLFRRPQFVAANLAGVVVFFAFVGSIVYFSAYFQQVQGRSPVQAGLDISAIGIAFAVTAPIAGRIVGRIGAQGPLIGGLVIAGGSMLLLLRLTPHTPIADIWWNFATLGAGIGLCLTPMTAIAVSSVTADHAGMASAILNALRQFGQVLGVALLGALVHAHVTVHGTALSSAQRSAFVAGLHRAIWVGGIALIATAAVAAALFLLAKRTESSDPGRNQRVHGYDPAALADLQHQRISGQEGEPGRPR